MRKNKPFLDISWAFQSIIVGLWLIIAIIVTVRLYGQKEPLPRFIFPVVSETEKNKVFNVAKIVVIRGNYFDLTLKENDIHFFGKLDVSVKEEAKIKLLEFLNNIKKPTVVLKKKQSEGCWIIDFFVIDKEEEINLVEWLNSNNLVIK